MCDRHSATIQGDRESGEGASQLSCSPVNFACYGFINKSTRAGLTSPSSF